MKRILPLLLVLSLGAAAFGCKDKSDDNKDGNTSGDTGNPGGGGQPGSPGGPGSPGTGNPGDATTNPTEGIEPASAVLEVGAFTDGPVWHAGMGVVFFTTPLGEGALFRMLPDGRQMKLRDGVSTQGTQPIGTTVNAAGELITVDAKRVVKQAAEGVGDPILIADKYTGVDAQPPDPLNPNAPPPGPATGTFDTLNDVVARADGTLYVTDPGYFTPDPGPAANRIYRITPDGAVQVVEAFDDVPRPNGIVLSPDEKTLYVGFERPLQGTLPFIRKYTVNDDGTLGEWTKFADIGPEDSSPDGLAIDKVGNLYVATKAGIEVYKPSGEKWGVIAIPEQPTGMTFGGPDMKTLFVTTQGVKIWQLKMKVEGISH